MGIFSAFKKKQTYTLYKSTSINEAYFQSRGYNSREFRLKYYSLEIFKDAYDGFGNKFEDYFRPGSVEKIEVSSDLPDLIQKANEVNNFEKRIVKEKLVDFFGQYFCDDDLTSGSNSLDGMFNNFENLLEYYNRYK